MPKIFLLEDDPAVAELLRTSIELEKWDLLWHTTVTGAVEAFRRFGADLALLDLSLPDGSGLSVCRSIKADREISHIPIIILTSIGDPQSRLKGFAFGCQDYVPKPFVLQELLARIRAHLAIKAREEGLQRDILEERLHARVRQDVVDMIVHDLKSPLATIRITLELIRRHGVITQEPITQYLRSAESSVEFALFMVNDLLDLRSGKLAVALQPMDLRAICGKIETLIKLQCTTKGVTLEVDLTEDILPIVTDAALVFRILVNLLSNALKFSRSGERVVLKGRAVAGKVLRLEVQDSGPGIPPAEMEDIFKKFYRANTAENQMIPGSGVGLAFCRMAAETLGGLIWAENRKDGPGSRFILELPAKSP